MQKIFAPPTFSIYPNTQYDQQTGKPGTTTYVVDNTVYVTVHQLDKLGDLLDATVQAGANSVNNIQFDVADKSSAIQQARDQAVKDAQTQAQELASAQALRWAMCKLSASRIIFHSR